jgi:capsular polysaccharide biosynthesis protein
MRSLSGRAPEKLDAFANLKTFRRKTIFGGACFEMHYGHFLTEAFARLWYAVANDQDPILCHAFQRDHPRRLAVDRFFSAVDFSSDRFITFKEPVLLSEVVLPQPSFRLKTESFEVHRLIPENVAARLLVSPPKTTAQPLYLSRGLLPKWSYRPANEDRLIEKLTEKGFAIAYPERLTLDEQIYLINKHETIVGVMGSALHGALFDLSPEACRNVVCLTEKDLSIESRLKTYLMFDILKSLKSTYIVAIDAVQSPQWKVRTESAVLDLETSIRGLRDLDLL